MPHHLTAIFTEIPQGFLTAGGIYGNDPLTLVNVTLTNNTISNNNTNDGPGGGLRIVGSGEVTLTNNTISFNHAYGSGGAILSAMICKLPCGKC
mgnify:CR=1 FL=1